METVVGVDNNSDEGKFEECGVEKSSSCLSSPKHIADPVVYKLVRVHFFNLCLLDFVETVVTFTVPVASFTNRDSDTTFLKGHENVDLE